MSLLERCKDTFVEFKNLTNLARGQVPKAPPQSEDDSNPITLWFELKEKATTAGPGLIWTVYNASNKMNGMECSVFFFDKRDGDKLFRPKRKEEVFKKMRDGVQYLVSGDFKQTLQILHKLEEGPNTMAFATEPVMTSLHHVFAWYEAMFDQRPILPHPPSLHYRLSGRKKKYKKPALAPFAKEYFFMEIEMAYGFMQIAEALGCLHYDKEMVHTNICPQNIVITTNGVWKLIGLEFLSWLLRDTTCEKLFSSNMDSSTSLLSEVPKNELHQKRVEPIVIEEGCTTMAHDPFNVKANCGSEFNLDGAEPIEKDSSSAVVPLEPLHEKEKLNCTSQTTLDSTVTEPAEKESPSEMMAHDPFNVKFNCASQSNLDYSAPEIQEFGQISKLSDMFSFGMIIAAFFNNGRSLFDANDNPMLYLKQLKTLTHRVAELLPLMPISLQEAAERMLLRDAEMRPPTALLPLTKYFGTAAMDPVILALQGFNGLQRMTQPEKIKFLKSVSQATIDKIPKKLRFPFIFDCMTPELKTADGLAYGLAMIVYMVKDEPDEFCTNILYPIIRSVYTKYFINRNALAVNAYLNSVNFFLIKCDSQDRGDIREEIIKILIITLENNDKSVLATAVECIMKCMEWLDDDVVMDQVLPNIRGVLERYYSDMSMSITVLNLFDMLMAKLDKQHLIAYVVPSLMIMKLNEPTVMERVVSLYKIMVTDERLGLPHELMATKMLPSVVPHAVNKRMDQAQLSGLMEMLYHMLDTIEHEQRIVIEEYKNRPPSPPVNPARRQASIDEPAPEFYIPVLRRKVSSAEEMARKNSANIPPPSVSATSVAGNIRRISQWFFGSNNSTNSNNMNHGAGPSGIAAAASGNFLRVANLLPGRRLSDNTLMAPKIKIAPSCSSSPGGTPGGSQAGLPARRHSSIGPQERRGSHVNLSPPTAQYGRRRGGSGSSLSVPVQAHPAGGSLPGSGTTYLDPPKGSAQSVHSAQSAIAARAVMSLRTTPTRMRRPSGCPPSASSGAAAASLQATDFAHCSVNSPQLLFVHKA